MSLKLYRRKAGGIWHYRGTVGPASRRRRLRGSTHTKDKDVAARQVAELEKRYWDGHFDGPAAILTFDQACLEFISGGNPCMIGGTDAVQAARDYFMHTPVKDIKSKTVRKFANDTYGHCTNASKNRMAITPVQSVINYCAEELELCDAIKIKRFPPVHKEKEPATLEWVQAFMTQAKPHLGAYALFMFLTGARPSEALAIDPDKDLDLQKAEATIRQTKIEKDKKVVVIRKAHLPPMLVAALANLKGVPGRPLFVYRKYGDMLETWHNQTENAGILNLTPHCCRHGFATELLRRGVDVHTVAWLGGWASAAQVLETYGHAIKKRDLTNLIAGTDLTQAVDEVVSSVGKLSVISNN